MAFQDERVLRPSELPDAARSGRDRPRRAGDRPDSREPTHRPGLSPQHLEQAAVAAVPDAYALLHASGGDPEPSGLQATASTLHSWPTSTWGGASRSTSQFRTTPSLPEVAIRWPSGLQARLYVFLEGIRKVLRGDSLIGACCPGDLGRGRGGPRGSASQILRSRRRRCRWRSGSHPGSRPRTSPSCRGRARGELAAVGRVPHAERLPTRRRRAGARRGQATDLTPPEWADQARSSRPRPASQIRIQPSPPPETIRVPSRLHATDATARPLPPRTDPGRGASAR